MVVFGIFSLILLGKSPHFKDNTPELFELLFTFLAFVIFIVFHLIIQKFFIVFDARLEHFKVLICVLLKFIDFESQFIGFLEDNSLYKLFFFLDFGFHIIVELIHFLVHLILEFLEIFFKCSYTRGKVFLVGLTDLDVGLELVSNFGEHVFHLTVFLCHHIHYFFDLIINVVT